MTVRPSSRRPLALAACLGAAVLAAAILPAAAQQPARSAQGAQRPTGLNALGGGSKEPIAIDADRLDVFDKDRKAIFAGNVVAVQAETTIKCSEMTVFYEAGAGGLGGGRAQPAANAPAAQPAAPGGSTTENAIRRVECKGPVTVSSKDQVATGERAVFDRVANLVTLSGNAALSQGENVTRGERIVYNVTTGIANVEGGGGRVRALLVPGQDDAKPGEQKPKAGEAKPR